MRPRKLWVIYGGESSERGVSIKSGKNIVEALGAKGFEVKGIELARYQDLLGVFQLEKPDLVFLGLHGGDGENGKTQGFLDTLGVPYVGSGVLSSAICFNKLITQRILKDHQMPIANFLECTKENFSLTALLKVEPNLFKKKWFIKQLHKEALLEFLDTTQNSLMKQNAKMHSKISVLKHLDTITKL